MVLRATEIGDILRTQIAGFEKELTVSNVGTVVEVGDGIARVYGLSQVMASELVEFTKNGVLGLAFNLEEDSVGVIIMGEYTELEEGDEVRATGRIASVPVGEALVGRVVNALGQPIDGKGPITTDKTRPVERIAPGVILRQDVDTALQTGIKAIDSMISSPMAVPAKGAMYCNAAGSEADATTTMVWSMAPYSSRSRTIWATCARFWPMAT